MAKTIEEIKDELAKSRGYGNLWYLQEDYASDGMRMEIFMDEVCTAFANSKLEEAAECANMKCEWKNSATDKVEKTEFLDGCNIGDFRYTVNKQSILNLREEV